MSLFLILFYLFKSSFLLLFSFFIIPIFFFLFKKKVLLFCKTLFLNKKNSWQLPIFAFTIVGV